MKETERYSPPFCDFNVNHKMAEVQILCVNSKSGYTHEVSMSCGKLQVMVSPVPDTSMGQVSESLTSEEVR